MGKKREKQLGEGGDEDGKKEKKAGKKKKKQKIKNISWIDLKLIRH